MLALTSSSFIVRAKIKAQKLITPEMSLHVALSTEEQAKKRIYVSR
jgi:hypothetical protein